MPTMEGSKAVAAPGFLRPDASQRGARPLRLAGLLQVLLAVVALLAPGAARTSEYVPKLTQYAHASWRVQDGDLGGWANAMTQTRDGYIWVGTAAGLERYDGVRFRRWKLPKDTPVYGLLAGRDGSLWASQDRRVNRLRGGKAEVFQVEGGGRFNGLYEDRAGGIWVARTRGADASGGLCQVGRSNVHCYGPADGQVCAYGVTVSQDLNGVFWLGSDQGACHWRPGQPKPADSDARHGPPGVVALSPEPDGAMLAGFTRSGPRLGLQRVTVSGSEPFLAGDLNGESLAVRALLRDREGTLWIGTDHGLYHVVAGKADHLGRADGLSGDEVNALFEDREGEIWAATSGGVDKFRRQPVTAITTREGLSADAVLAALGRRDGSVWVATSHGLDVVAQGAIRHIGPEQGLPGQTVASLLEDHAGRLWLGIDNDLAWSDGKRFHLVRKPDGEKLGVMVDLAEDGRGDIWALSTGRPYRLYHVRGGRFLGEVKLPKGPANPALMAAANDGAIWVADHRANLFVYRGGPPVEIAGPPHGDLGLDLKVLAGDEILLTTNAGIQRWSKGRWTLLDASRGLPCDRIGSTLLDAKGYLWIRAECGMIVMARTELARLAETPAAKAKVRVLDGADGAQPGFPSFKPLATASPDGRLWFATGGPLITVDPATLSSNTLPPPVHVERILADRRAYAPGMDIALPPLTRDVEIDYAGLSLIAPQKMRFRYRLSRVDSGWQDVETRRAAFYQNLKPGHYVFQVIAGNNDGVWNLEGDTTGFTIKPAIYQTMWFQALVVLLLAALAALAVRQRLRAVANEIETRLSARQAERVRIARELHDTLLQGFQGLLVRFQVVADAIPRGDPARPMMEAVLDRADEILVQGRDRVRDLRSEEDGGSPILKALEGVAFALERDGCPPIEVRSLGAPRELDPDVQREFVAIAREALLNACKHAEAGAILCQLVFTPAAISLVVEDDGVGIDEAVLRAGGRPGHWGLTGMRERARQIGARLRVTSLLKGTQVELSLNTRLDRLRKLVRRLSLVGAP